MGTLRFEAVLTAEGWITPGYVSVDRNGLISGLADQGSGAPVDVIRGIAVPGLANVHSHAFQRSMAGLSEFRTGAGHDSFWTWRDLMYRFVTRITPDDLEAIAAQLYVEMLKSGYTAVGEFQYIHNDHDGSAFADPAEMTLRTVAAASHTGIGATFLPVLYQCGGFGNLPPTEGQRRFVTDTERFSRILEKLASVCTALPDCCTGIAPHSLRAVSPSALDEMLEIAGSEKPIHIHISEQEQEVLDCQQWSGRRPVEWLLENMPVDHRWCLVHATHMTAGETDAAAATGATVGLCPTTEANLGDGLFPLRLWLDAGGRFGIGSDSHVSVSPVEELRWLEYGQRLRDRRRNIAGDDETSTGVSLFTGAVAGGARCLGIGDGLLDVGSRADLVVLDHDAALFAGQQPETILDSWIFSGNISVVKDVFVGGKQVIRDHRHQHEAEIGARYRTVMTRLLVD